MSSASMCRSETLSNCIILSSILERENSTILNDALISCYLKIKTSYKFMIKKDCEPIGKNLNGSKNARTKNFIEKVL